MKKDKKGLSRREFLSRSASGVASLGLLALPKRLWSFPAEKKVIYRTLGKTGIELPIVNMGVMNSLNPDLVKRSYEIGVRYFDTAAGYQRGQNEIMVGRAIKELGVREKVIIGTKVNIPHDQRSKISTEEAKTFILKTAEASLQRLQSDYLDILYLHDVQDSGIINHPGTQDALRTLKEQKKVRFVGFTTHNNKTGLILDAVTLGFYEVILVGFNYALADDPDFIAALQKAQANGIGLIAMKTQCAQLWYKEELPAEMQAYYQGRLMHTALLKWVLQHDFIACAVPGYTTFAQMEEDFSVAHDLAYTPEEKTFLQDRNVKLALGRCCRQCEQCVPTCPLGVHIPTLMRSHMYATRYGNLPAAREALETLPNARDLRACRACGECTARCVRTVDVRKRIADLKSIYA
jgi:predicted aldo/keto reductase-like oxidoreductase